MKTIANFIWFIFPGYLMAIINVLLGVVLCCTLVLFPLGQQLIKLANCFVLPMKKKFETNFKQRPLGNVLYNLFMLGFINAIIMILVATLYCVTIIGIPLGKKAYRLALVAICPVGIVAV